MRRSVRLLVSTIALSVLFLWAARAQAMPSYFSSRCAPCHSNDATSCSGCHEHGTHSSPGGSDINIKATTNKTAYTPGEAMTVSVTGGNGSSYAGWVRVIVYNQSGAAVARSSGPCNNPSLPDHGCGSGDTFPGPIVLSTQAPTTDGTYSYKASWYGNQTDTGGFFGPNWRLDPANASHGEQIVSTNSFTVKTPAPVCTDNDLDGFATQGGACGPVDCNDNNAAINPSAVENCTDGIDNNCNGLIDAKDPAAVGCPPICTDNDRDGFATQGGACGPVDCNDNNAAINPSAAENCTDGIDNNCNGLIDGADPAAVGCPPVCTDRDRDGFALEGGACGPVDCNDNNAGVNPSAVENCTDGIDNNCNGLIDGADPAAVGCPPVCTDRDRDGFAVEGGACGPVDCNDGDAAINPAAAESCTDGIDNNCNGLVDRDDPAAVGCPPTCPDNDHDGFATGGGTCGPVDCNDGNAAINPAAAENCTDGIDNNCNGLVDRQDPAAVNCPVICTDKDGDHFSPDGGTCGKVDCNDGNAAVNPGAVEDCADGIDNNCDGLVDAADPTCKPATDDYDIVGFVCTSVITIDPRSRTNPKVALGVSIQNQGKTDPGTLLTVKGTLAGQTISITPEGGLKVNDPPGGGRKNVIFSYAPQAAGTIDWRATLQDGNSDIDQAACKTKVVLKGHDDDEDDDDHHRHDD